MQHILPTSLESLVSQWLALNFAKYVTLRNKKAKIWEIKYYLSSVTSCGCVL